MVNIEVFFCFLGVQGHMHLIPDSSFDYRRKKNSSIVSFWKTFSLLNFLCCTLQVSTTFNFISLKVRIFSYHSKYRKMFLIFASTDRFISLPLPQFPMPHKRPVQLGGTSFQLYGAFVPIHLILMLGRRAASCLIPRLATRSSGRR